jgi:hypothetical protein
MQYGKWELRRFRRMFGLEDLAWDEWIINARRLGNVGILQNGPRGMMAVKRDPSERSGLYIILFEMRFCCRPPATQHRHRAVQIGSSWWCDRRALRTRLEKAAHFSRCKPQEWGNESVSWQLGGKTRALIFPRSTYLFWPHRRANGYEWANACAGWMLYQASTKSGICTDSQPFGVG